MKEKLKQLFGLFGAFAVVGVTTFGGGYAMLPALQREVVEKALGHSLQHLRSAA